MMSRLSRRELLKYAAAGAAGAVAVPYLIPSGVLAADGKPGVNERIRVGAIGVGNRASLLLDQLPETRRDRRPLRLQSAAGRALSGQAERPPGRCTRTTANSWNARTSTR